MYIYFHPNPCGRTVGDCAVRAIMEFQNLLNDAPNERIRQKMMECLGEM